MKEFINCKKGVIKLKITSFYAIIKLICIIIPCHRVVGINGSLTWYRCGIRNKIVLLKLEKNNMSNFFVSKRGTDLWKDVNGVI